jgi:hypothetical protein
VFDAYVSLVHATLHRGLHGASAFRYSTLARELSGKLHNVPPLELRRVLLAPDFTNRLLWQQPDRIELALEFLDKALRVEGMISGREKANCDAWTALGDAMVLRNGEVQRGARIAGMPPLDFDSPYPTNDSSKPTPMATPAHFRSLSGAVRPLTLERMATAWSGLSAASLIASDFVTQFVQVIALRRHNERAGFSSGSYRGYIGRVVLGNPDSEFSSDIRIVEALVHEAIHAMLYMTLYPVAWGVEDSRCYAEGEKVVSPWTGASLKLSSFLQACFVWYGLLNFWWRALERNAFRDTDRASRRLEQALKGFQGTPLLNIVGHEDRKVIRDDVSDAVELLQEKARTSL